MRIFHVADLHYANETLAEVDRCFGFAVDEAITRRCDCAVIAGDTCDHRLDLHSPAVAAVLRQVRRLADVMPVLILQGTASHDTPGSLEVFKTLGGKHPVHVATSIQQVVLMAGGWMVSDGWAFAPADVPSAKVLFSCLPSVNKGAVAAAVGCADAAKAVGEQVAALLAGWAAPNLKARALRVPAVVVSHGTVSGSITEHGVPMAGLDHEYTTGSLFSAEASAVMLGHIHQMQAWERDGRRIAYPGSVGRLHFGELTDKGFLIWDARADGADAEFVTTPAKRLLQVEFQGAPDMAELERIAADCAHAHVRIRCAVDEEHRASVDRDAIRTLFAPAAALKLEVRINPVQRVRAAGISQAPTLADQLRQWCLLTDTVSDPLIERLAMLEGLEPEEIVARLVGTQPPMAKKTA